MTKLAIRGSLAAIHHYLAEREAGNQLAHLDLCQALAGTPGAVETDIETLDTMEVMAERARAAATMLTARARELEAGVESLKTELLTIINGQGLESLEGLTRKFVAQTSGGETAMHLSLSLGQLGNVVAINTAENLPADLKPFLQHIDVWTLNKTALRDALKAGQKLDWAHLEGRGKHVVIKPL